MSIPNTRRVRFSRGEEGLATLTRGASLDLFTPIHAGTLVANQRVDPVIEALAPKHFFIPRLLIPNDHGRTITVPRIWMGWTEQRYS